MSRNQPQFTVTVAIRKIQTGHRVFVFGMEDMNHAYSVAKILIASPAYAHCYAVGTSWNGDTLFNVQPEAQHPAPYQAPQPAQLPYYPPPQHAYPQHQGYPQQQHYQQQPQYPALPHYQQPQQHQYPQQPHYPQQQQPQRIVVDAEFVDNRPALPQGSR